MIDFTPINDVIKQHAGLIFLASAGTLIAGTASVVAAAFNLIIKSQKTSIDSYRAQIENVKAAALVDAGAARQLLEFEQNAHNITKQHHAVEILALTTQAKAEIETIRNTYEIRARRIERTVVGGDFIDIAKFGPVDEVSDAFEKRLFGNDKFWAHDEPAIWDYEYTNWNSIFAEWFGRRLQDIPLLRRELETRKGELASPVHIWKATKAFRKAVSTHAFIETMYPFVIVERVPVEQGATQILYSFLKWIDAFESADDNTSFVATNVQNVQGNLYLRGHFQFKKINVGTVSYDRYYLMRELMCLPTVNGMYVITTGIPNEKRSSEEPYFAYLATWLNDFRIAR